MSYTTVYRFQDLNGYESVISKANSDMTYEGFGRILLNPGQTLEYKVTGEEQAIVLQQGDMTCWVEYEGVTVVDGAKGQRGNVYDDLPTALYVPPKATVKLYSEKGMEARVFTAYCEEGNAPISARLKILKRENPASTSTSGSTASSSASPASTTTTSPSC